MENKTFKLPSKFAQKWLTALRSGEFEQLEGQLIDCTIAYPKDGGEIEIVKSDTKKGCCLGVAAVVLGATDLELRNHGMPYEVNQEVWDRIGYPKILQEKSLQSIGITPLPVILANLNDGLTLSWANNVMKEYPNLKFHKLPERYFYDIEVDDEVDGEPMLEYYSFEDIAKFIEDNVEFEDEGV